MTKNRVLHPFIAIWAGAVASLSVLASFSAGVAGDSPTDAKGAERRTWDFERDAVGMKAAGFKPAVGEWSIVADGKNRVLAQSAKNDDSTFNIVLIDDANYVDIDLRVRLKAIDGKVDQGGGVVWRAKDAKNYYISRFNPLESNFRVYKVVDGKRTQLETAKVSGDSQWHTLRIMMQGSRIKCFLDDKLHLEADDDTFRGAGGIGLWCKADAQTYFDDLVAVGVVVKGAVADEP